MSESDKIYCADCNKKVLNVENAHYLFLQIQQKIHTFVDIYGKSGRHNKCRTTYTLAHTHTHTQTHTHPHMHTHTNHTIHSHTHPFNLNVYSTHSWTQCLKRGILSVFIFLSVCLSFFLSIFHSFYPSIRSLMSLLHL